MNRYDSPSDIRKCGNQRSNPTLFSTPTKLSCKLSIPNITQPDFSKADETTDIQPQGRSNQLTFKPQQSCTSNINPFSELYLQSNNVTENQDLNASLIIPADLENVLESDCSMEIPNERFNDTAVLKYFSHKEDLQPLETFPESIITNQEIVTVSKEGKGFFTEPISPPHHDNTLYGTQMKPVNNFLEKKNITPTKRTLPRQNKVKSVTKRKHYEGVLDELLQREKENKNFSPCPAVRIRTCGSPSTPRLGRSPFNSSSSIPQRNKSKCNDERKRSRDVSVIIGEDAKENLKKITLNLEETNKEREYLKIYVQQLKSLLKKEQDEIVRLGNCTKGLENDFKKLGAKQKQSEKQGIDIKDQLQRTKDEVLKLLEEVETSRRNLEPLIERINIENEELEKQKLNYNAHKFSYSELMKDKEKQKAITLNSRRGKQRIIVAFEHLERENLNYIQTIEHHLTENNEN